MINLLLVLNFTYSKGTVNYRVHNAAADWGGWLCGMGLGLVMTPKVRPQADYVGSYEKLCMKMGAVFLLIYWSILFSCYWTVYMPPQHY